MINEKNTCTKKVAIKDLIEIYDRVNRDGDTLDFLGLNKNKQFMPSVADTNEVDNRKYKIVEKDIFAFSGMQTGRDNCIRIGLYKEDKKALVSPAYTTFKVKETQTVLPEYFYLNISRFEMDRYGAFLSDSSIRSNLDWNRFLEIEIPLPSIEIQRELVAIYEGLQNIISKNEALIQNLSAVSEGFIANCNKKYNKVQLDEYIEELNSRNVNDALTLGDVRGISISKKFIPTKANMDGVSLSNYKIVHPQNLAYVTVTSRNGGKISLTMNNEDQDFLVSSSYIVFHSTNEMKLLPEYLFLIFNRSEFDRYSRFNSWGSARETFDFEELCRTQISLPPIEVQQSIVKILQCIETAKKIVVEAKELMQKICPALVQKASHSR